MSLVRENTRGFYYKPFFRGFRSEQASQFYKLYVILIFISMCLTILLVFANFLFV